MAPRSSIEGRMLLLKRRYFWLICGLVSQMLLNSAVSGQSHCFLPPNKSFNREFKQRTSRFWEFEEKTNTWVEIRLPFDLTACTNGTCTKVGSIENLWKKRSPPAAEQHQQKEAEVDSGDRELLPIRKRVSLTRMSEASIWVTGQSGSIYERFWNGVRWVIAPHELPASAGTAVSIFIVNQTILSLSEAGILYLLQLNENSQPIWSDLVLNIEPRIESAEAEARTTMVIKTGAVSHDGERLLLTTAYGSLLEISEFQPLRWENHGRPPGGDVSVLADTGSLKTSAVFTIRKYILYDFMKSHTQVHGGLILNEVRTRSSDKHDVEIIKLKKVLVARAMAPASKVRSSGDLYEFDKKTKPSWKKHIWSEASREAVLLSPSTGCTLHGLVGHNSLSLFLLTQDGYLLERRLHKRKWKWIIHEVPKGHQLSSLTIVKQNQISEKELSMFFTTRNGLVFEYQLPKLTGVSRKDQIKGVWVNHKHPQHAKVARGISGVQLQLGRLVFPLDDGRIAELHFSGIGGEAASPTHQINVRKKTLYTFEWSILEAPESEGWNAEYCTNERGPLNCIAGMMDVVADDESNDLGIIAPGRRLKAPANQHYLFLPNHESSSRRIESNNVETMTINLNFRMRMLHADRSFFLITDSGLTCEYLYADNIWLWLRHEHPTAIKGALGSYNGSLFLVDTHGNLLMRERNGNELSWINCTSMKKGKQVASGPPWDGMPGKSWRVTSEDALFFVNKRGRLLQFTVALRKFKWKDCRSPPDTRVAFIVDQEVLRMNIIFVVGRNGRLYQYNKLTELWHAHYQSPHLVLSRSPGTAMRPSLQSLSGSIFMVSENGGLVEYHWNTMYGWEWVEHGTPAMGITLVGAPGPCLGSSELFVIGSNGCVYRRQLYERTWRWTNYGYPQTEDAILDAKVGSSKEQCCAMDDHKAFYGENGHNSETYKEYCNQKVAPVRPIPFSEDSLVFELQDGRIAELRRSNQEVSTWEWVRIIGTPNSICLTNYWTAVAS